MTWRGVATRPCPQVGTIFQPLATKEMPPTYFQTNKVTAGTTLNTACRVMHLIPNPVFIEYHTVVYENNTS